MKFYGMQRTLEMLLNTKGIDQLGTDEFIHMLIQSEWEDRENRKEKPLHQSNPVPSAGTAEQVDFTTDRNLNKTSFLHFADRSFINKGENILILSDLTNHHEVD